jgi:DNA topoisomerase-1
VLEGRYGPYVTDGETNASVPKGMDPATLTLDDARALIEARKGAPPRAARGRAAAAARGGGRRTRRAAAAEPAAAPVKKERAAPAAKSLKLVKPKKAVLRKRTGS